MKVTRTVLLFLMGALMVAACGGPTPGPTILAPAQDTILLGADPILQWSSIGWADSYHIQIAESDAFLPEDMVIDEEGYSGQSCRPELKLYGGKYYWRVKAMNSTAETEWSATGTFTISPTM